MLIDKGITNASARCFDDVSKVAQIGFHIIKPGTGRGTDDDTAKQIFGESVRLERVNIGLATGAVANQA